MSKIVVGKIKGSEPETLVFITVNDFALERMHFREIDEVSADLSKAGWAEAKIEAELAKVPEVD